MVVSSQALSWPSHYNNMISIGKVKPQCRSIPGKLNVFCMLMYKPLLSKFVTYLKNTWILQSYFSRFLTPQQRYACPFLGYGAKPCNK
jgi:hypothetical protein